MQMSEKGDFDWALVICAAARQKTGSHWTQFAVFLAVGPFATASIQNGAAVKVTATQDLPRVETNTRSAGPNNS
jgi:hypothetical protein